MIDKLGVTSLEEAGVALIDCVHKTPQAQDAGYPYVAIPQLVDGRINLAAARRISENDFLDWTRKAEPREFDVVLSRRCNPGETAHVPQGAEFALGQNLVLLRSDGTRIFPPFLRWLVRTPQWWDEVGKFINVGAVFTSLKCRDVPKFELPLPSLAMQERLAHILGTLDDKIELSRRMNQTLEAIARATFKAWFVDFDPVKAKAAATIAGNSQAEIQRAAMAAISGAPEPELDNLPEPQRQSLAQTAALFPAAFSDSDLGEIPAGWGTGKLSDVIELIGGGTPKKSEPAYWGGDIPWFSVKDAPSDGEIYVLETALKITDRGLNESSTKLLEVGTTIISARGTVGRLALVGQPMAMNQSCYGVVGADGLPPTFTYFNLHRAVESLRQNTHGAVFDTITRSTFESVDQVMPLTALVFRFETQTDPILQRIKSNGEEARTLTELRDNLLRKLLPGTSPIPAESRN